MGVWIETCFATPVFELSRVTPCMGVWIETQGRNLANQVPPVTPCMGVWIETTLRHHNDGKALSHPVWVCGLKPDKCRQ